MQKRAATRLHRHVRAQPTSSGTRTAVRLDARRRSLQCFRTPGDGGERENEYPRPMEDADRDLLEFVGDQGKTAGQVVERFPAFDLERLVRAELIRPRRTNPSRRSRAALRQRPRRRSTCSRLEEPRQSASLRTRFTRTDDRLANEPCGRRSLERSRGLDDGVLLTPREGELDKEEARRPPRSSAVERARAAALPSGTASKSGSNKSSDNDPRSAGRGPFRSRHCSRPRIRQAVTTREDIASVASPLPELTHTVEAMAKDLKGMTERADRQQTRADNQQDLVDSQQARAQMQQERIDLAARELADVSDRLQAAATALRDSI